MGRCSAVRFRETFNHPHPCDSVLLRYFPFNFNAGRVESISNDRTEQGSFGFSERMVFIRICSKLNGRVRQKNRSNHGSRIFFLEFGDHRLDLMLIIWSNRYDRKWETRDYINIKVLQRFREENIEIPYPQRDVYIHERDQSSLKPRSVWEPMNSGEEDE
jgi:Small-conductance mechanosensitive channel